MLRLPQIPPKFTSKPIADVAAGLGIDLTEDRHPWYTCCCPFHGETNPSFRVNVDENFFRCFGCDARGDALELVYLWRSRNNSKYTRYDAYLEVCEGEETLADGIVIGGQESGPGPRALAEYLAATRGRLSRQQADELVMAQ